MMMRQRRYVEHGGGEVRVAVQRCKSASLDAHGQAKSVERWAENVQSLLQRSCVFMAQSFDKRRALN